MREKSFLSTKSFLFYRQGSRSPGAFSSLILGSLAGCRELNTVVVPGHMLFCFSIQEGTEMPWDDTLMKMQNGLCCVTLPPPLAVLWLWPCLGRCFLLCFKLGVGATWDQERSDITLICRLSTQHRPRARAHMVSTGSINEWSHFYAWSIIKLQLNSLGHSLSQFHFKNLIIYAIQNFY